LTWLTRTPLALVRACARMLPKLEAEEALDAVTRLTVGVGRLPARELRRVVDSWQRSAGQETVVRPKTLQEFAATVGSMGLGVQIVEPGGGARG